VLGQKVEAFSFIRDAFKVRQFVTSDVEDPSEQKIVVVSRPAVGIQLCLAECAFPFTVPLQQKALPSYMYIVESCGQSVIVLVGVGAEPLMKLSAIRFMSGEPMMMRPKIMIAATTIPPIKISRRFIPLSIIGLFF
jgi:hypothetical protein